MDNDWAGKKTVRNHVNSDDKQCSIYFNACPTWTLVAYCNFILEGQPCKTKLAQQ